MQMTDYRTFGRSGLIVSPLALGTMTFGAGRWGSDETEARAIFDTYVAAGGNLLDTADVYSGGESERMLGQFVADSGMRDQLVVSTKSGFARSQGHPMHGGNSAFNIRQGIEGSLRRLGTDRIDLYWVHVWDRTTPAEEVLRTLADAVARGQILYYGFSNTPAWYVAKVATLAAAHGLPGPIGLQNAWSLVERGIELDLLPMAQEFGLGIMPWSPLAGGFLTGKYGREMLDQADRASAVPDRAMREEGGSRDRLSGDNPYGGMLFHEQNFRIVDTVRDIAGELDIPMAQVALAWVLSRPGMGSLLLGASRPQQVTDNFTALKIRLNEDQLNRLNAVSAVPLLNPYFIFQLPREVLFGGQSVTPWRLG
ncbi:aldo/keto reductase [Roseinatronobacter sp. S2]|uniref:aldo/keto reductase n=1 Tax=Roseinatronobacter sp. S2 TaxID=3035471 RepID=UPI00240F9313|nr:aldo/keto reductase [Roseinatronobacter sp. S2]WFE77013.1 aldo/keto reductase [Roseinatronobacter sp. S2]